MKKLLKLLFFILLLIIISAGGYLLYLKYFVKQAQTEAFNAVPADSFIILQTTDLYKAYDNISQSQLWKYLIKTQYFADIKQDFETIDKYVRSTNLPENFFQNRPLITAINIVGGTWDVIYIIDLKDIGKLSSTIEPFLYNIPEYKTFKQSYSPDRKHQYTIYKLVYLPDQYQKIYISINKNLLIISENKKILEKSLSELAAPSWKTNEKFQALLKKEKHPGIITLFINFHKLDAFIRTFQIVQDPYIKALSEGLNYGMLNLNIKGNTLILEGSVGIDTVNSYFTALRRLAPGRLESYNILSDQTAAMASISFNNYSEFYDEFMQAFEKEDSRQAYETEKAINILNKSLGIDIKQNLISWIGKEIALYKLTPEYGKRAEDVIITIHTKEPVKAKENLNIITKKIKKITPFKFKDFEYKGFTISYLKINGFFKLFFGKMFDQIEKPYFTIIENFVVFSNSPITLEKVIDDYLNGYTLTNNKKFNDFIDNFSQNSSFFAYINMPLLFKNLLALAPPSDKKSLLENKELINGFSLNGIQLTSQNQFMKIKIISVYDPEASIDLTIKQIEKQAEIQNLLQQIDSLKLKISTDTLPRQGEAIIYYPNTQQIFMQGQVRDGQPFGLWRIYYPNGNIKMVQTFNSNGQLDGIVQLFYDNKANSKLAEFYITNDKIHGILLQYYPNGQIKAKIEYKEGKKHGTVTFYYPEGQVQIQGRYKEGKKHGKWIFYDKAGNKISEEKWKNGIKK